MRKRLAKWLTIRLGNLAVKLAPMAGLDLVFHIGGRRVPQRPAVSEPKIAESAVWTDIRITPIQHRNPWNGIPENYMAWKIKAPTPAVAAELFCRRFLDEPHQGSRRMR
jgi:hypothetical protein